jgi:hypothetical protein
MKAALIAAVVAAVVSATATMAAPVALQRDESAQARTLKSRVYTLEQKVKNLTARTSRALSVAASARNAVGGVSSRVGDAERRLGCITSAQAVTRYSFPVVTASSGIHNWIDSTTGFRNVPASFTGVFGIPSLVFLDATAAGGLPQWWFPVVQAGCIGTASAQFKAVPEFQAVDREG